VSQLSRKCGSLDASQPYGPPGPVTRIALLFTSGSYGEPFQENQNEFAVYVIKEMY
jgi:hypothetical protein